jgi:hypothetical protein
MLNKPFILLIDSHTITLNNPFLCTYIINCDFRLTHSSAGVGCLKRVKNAIGVARAVMNYTKHSLMVGEDGK